MDYVHIKRGFGHGRVLENVDFPLVHGYKMGTRGVYVMVNGEGLPGYPQRNFKITLDRRDDAEFFDRNPDSTVAVEAGAESSEGAGFVLRGHSPVAMPVLRNPGADEIRDLDEPDEVIRDRMIERFGVLSQMSIASARGTVRGLVVYGAAGVGKSFEVVEAMKRVNAYNKVQFQAMMKDNPESAEDDEGNGEEEDRSILPIHTDNNPEPLYGEFAKEDPSTGIAVPQFYTYHVHKGHITNAALYALLYNNRHPNETLIMDDSDGVLTLEETLETLKGALDTTAERNLTWGTVNPRADSLPSSFLYEGSIVFITNTNFERLASSGSKIAPHIKAILDRCLYLDLMVETLREKLVRIDYVCCDLGMLERDLSSGADRIPEDQLDAVREELLAWTHDNSSRFRELSLRKMVHLAALRKGMPNWQRVAEITLLKGVR